MSLRMNDICCWWCCHSWKGPILQMPYTHSLKNNTFGKKGYFCSWSCMRSYAFSTYGEHQASKIAGNMYIMRKQMYGSYKKIQPAQCRYNLKMFGGTLTIEEFRDGCLIDADHSLNNARNETSNVPSEIKILPFNNTKYKMEEINMSQTNSNDTLRLKRAKPLKNANNNLEGLLGLTRRNN